MQESRDYRFAGRFQQIKSLGIVGLQDESDAVRHFYAKLDSRYYQFYPEKMNLVSRGIDKWPASLQSAFSEVERWIPPRATDWTNNRLPHSPLQASVVAVVSKTSFPATTVASLDIEDQSARTGNRKPKCLTLNPPTKQRWYERVRSRKRRRTS